MSQTWKTYEETWHGSKWGYLVVAIVLLVVISLLGAIFYLVGEGMRGIGLEPASVLFYTGVGALVIFVIVVVALKVGILAMASLVGFLGHIHGFLSVFWVLFKNIYVLIAAAILAFLLISAIFMASAADFQVSLTNPVVIGILIALLILFFPFAIFIVDLFSYEHE